MCTSLQIGHAGNKFVKLLQAYSFSLTLILSLRLGALRRVTYDSRGQAGGSPFLDRFQRSATKDSCHLNADHQPHGKAVGLAGYSCARKPLMIGSPSGSGPGHGLLRFAQYSFPADLNILRICCRTPKYIG